MPDDKKYDRCLWCNEPLDSEANTGEPVWTCFHCDEHPWEKPSAKEAPGEAE